MEKGFKIILAAIILSHTFNSCNSEPETETQINYNWPVSPAPELGLNNLMIESALTEAGKKDFINSILIIRNGKIAAERYFNGGNINTYQTIRSVSKSFLSALVGIAVQNGMIRTDQKMINFFLEYNSSNMDSRIKDITLEHLLTMRSGIKGDEEAYSTFTSSGNWIKTIIELPLDFAPGTKAQYSTAGTHLISGMLSRATGMSNLEFAKKYLFEPMGIGINDWARDPQGNYFGGNDMFFTTRNMAVLGLLYMNKGKLNGQQIIPEDWVNKSLVYSGGSGTVWGSLSKGGYGYLWWLGQLAGQNVFFALGHGGQFIVCVPALNMIIAATSNPYLDWDISDEHERAVLQIISEYIIPAVNE